MGMSDILSLFVDKFHVLVEMLSVVERFLILVLIFDGFCSDSEEVVGGLEVGG